MQTFSPKTTAPDLSLALTMEAISGNSKLGQNYKSNNGGSSGLKKKKLSVQIDHHRVMGKNHKDFDNNN